MTSDLTQVTGVGGRPEGSVTPPPCSANHADSAIALAWCGPAEHGIAQVAQQIADGAIRVGFSGTVLSESNPHAVGDLVARLPVGIRLLHLHVNDWLYAGGGADAGERIGSLADRLRRRGIGLALTLHDLPQVSDGPELFRRRTNNYRQFVRSADGVLVSSEHERLLLRQALTLTRADAPEPIPGSASASEVEVIPLPIEGASAQPPDADRRDAGRLDAERLAADRRDVDRPDVDRPDVDRPDVDRLDADHSGARYRDDGRRPDPGPRAPTIGIFGYLYPGKGHREVLEELAGMMPQISVIAIGRPSDRHDDLLPELAAVARRGGLDFRCTGYVADALVAERLREVTVPLAPHTHVSASGSINSWIAAGRRPLVPAGRYVGELHARLPGAVWIYQPGGLRSSVERALAHPELTRLPVGFEAGPTATEVAGGYLSWLRQLIARGSGVNQQPAIPSSPADAAT